MPMNVAHRKLCSSEKWARVTKEQILPFALAGVELGDDVLEIGPGYGANLRVLAERVPRLTAVEIDGPTARLLETRWGGRARVLEADASDLPLPEASFDAVVSFTMLHHVTTRAAQDRVFAEAYRVLRPGGVFAGSDSLSGLGFRLLHLFDTMNVLDLEELPSRLAAAGFTQVRVDRHPRGGGLRFRGTKTP
ncbi:methyltransferase type 11 [Streptomyces longispororuber]|uniref:Methyltransferase type 11 n=1 Tax=Streptomyces longispororuber TaxID=68230 RepID=A0A919DWD5_9ACTN|nr:class I SAM-dependent methyltransferase [Streptomyces longispororuber]GHE84702.1 methyltransferase type 11 [Streptomyces longispororuber]